jgi:nucleoside-diphosphate-sugar epimerase
MRIWMNGERGFIGSHLLPALLKAGHEIETDIVKLETEGWDYIIHLAATTHIRNEFDPNIYYNNVLLAHKILTQPSKVIYASSCSAMYPNDNPYAMSKAWAEHLGQKHPNAVGLRFFNAYGNNNNKGIVKFLMDQRQRSPICIRGPKLIRDYIHVSDIVNFIVNNLDIPKGIYEIGSGVGTETIELARLFNKLSGKDFRIGWRKGGKNEPEKMVAQVSVPHISLEQGLKNVIANG